MSDEPQRLVLWDIDHTLVSITGVSREIYGRAFEQLTGRPLVHLADMAGRTEQAISRETLALNGVQPDDVIDDFYAALGSAAHALEPRMREQGRALPGAREALSALAVDGVVQSVVTGNLRDIAVTKLEAFELHGFLDLAVGGFGDVSSDRAVLVRLAIEQAAAAYEYAFTAEHTIVIGDTPHDVKGAHDNGVVAVGVATGLSSADELAAVGADLVLPSLLDLPALQNVVLSRQ